jgi:predicted PurR-regulated permease PerM
MKYELFTPRNIIVGFLLLGFIVFFKELYSIFVLVFSAFIIFSSLKPIVDYLERKGLKRWMSVALVMMGFIVLISLFFTLVLNAAYRELREAFVDVELNATSITDFVDDKIPALSTPVSDVIEKFQKVARNEIPLSDVLPADIIGNINGFGVAGLKIAGGVVEGLFNVFLVVFISLYMILPKRDFFIGAINYFIPNDKKVDNYENLFSEIKNGLGHWLIGQLALMFFVGLLTYIVISIPGIFIQDYDLGRFALLLALVAGILEALPNIGPTITLVIATLLAILTGGSAAIIIYILVSFILIQQVEGVFLVPVIMKRAIDLNPIVAILVIVAGFSLTGSAIGALLSIPFAGSINIIFNHWKQGKL